ncbi:MAG: ribosomal protein S18-alanine N-acetyltransferase [Acholeplasmataceae bacterium]|nr:ribosomal protein S18-alanine N-acetyltransferase [Acholeplasmataceae bacterium]
MIRKAKPSDLFEIVKMENKVFKQSLGQTFLLEELTNNPFAHYFVMELNQQVIGYIGLRIVDQDAEMMNFIVDPMYQHQGYGLKLLTHTLIYLKEKGVKTWMLEVRKNNEIAKHLYQKFGFQKSHIRKKYYDNEDAIVYMKEV